MTQTTRRALLGGLAATPLLAHRAFAQGKAAWPERPIRLVVPFGAGTTTDALGRILADALARDAGQPVVVENRAGAGGNVGAQAVAQAPGDGYTLLLGTNGTHGINASLFTDQGFDPVKDFTPIAPFVTTPTVLGVPVSLKVNTVSELVALAKTKSLSFASAGNGTTGHLSQALLNLRMGLETQHIPYRNASQAITDLLAGRVDAMFYHPLGLKPHLEAGTLKALAVTSEKRITILPEVPTMQEAGGEGLRGGRALVALRTRRNAGGHRGPAEPRHQCPAGRSGCAGPPPRAGGGANGRLAGAAGDHDAGGNRQVAPRHRRGRDTAGLGGEAPEGPSHPQGRRIAHPLTALKV